MIAKNIRYRAFIVFMPVNSEAQLEGDAGILCYCLRQAADHDGAANSLQGSIGNIVVLKTQQHMIARAMNIIGMIKLAGGSYNRLERFKQTLQLTMMNLLLQGIKIGTLN